MKCWIKHIALSLGESLRSSDVIYDPHLCFLMAAFGHLDTSMLPSFRVFYERMREIRSPVTVKPLKKKGRGYDI